MREILFRGKTFDGEWEEGSLHIEYGETTAGGERNLDYCILGMRGECCYVDPETIGQFTGLCDKNGKKIFEGDIVEEYNIWDEFKRIGTVSWHDLFCGWHTGKPNAMHNGPVASYVIIGNIHDNPELLEVDNGT